MEKKKDGIRDFGENRTEQDAEASIIYTQWVNTNLPYMMSL